MAILVDKRGGVSGFICPRCEHWNMLGVYWSAHQHVELTGPCRNEKCDAKFYILGKKIKMQEQPHD